MKNLISIIIILCLTLSIMTPYAQAANSDVTPVQAANQYGYAGLSAAYEPTSAVNVSQTGQLLYQYNIDTKWNPASMTKLMTMYLTLEAVNKGQLSLDETITMTNKEYIMSTLPELSNTKLYPGQVWTIADLLQITVSNSSNAAALILAKKVSKNTSDFVDLMNNKAKAIGMKNTHFVNPTGAENSRLRTFAPTKYKDQERTVTTARDYAILDLHVIKETPKILDFTKQLAPTTHAVTYYTFNFSLEGAKMSLPGTDGLKTGSSDTANYNHTITTKRGKFRINQVIMGAGDYKNLGGEKQRNMMGNALMERSFDQYKYVKILSKGEQRINGKKYYVENDLYDVLPSDFSKKDYKLVVEDGKVHADYPREFINKDYGPPTVEVHQPIIQKANTVAKSMWAEHPLFTIIGGACLVAGLALIVHMIINRLFRKRK
ncbi:penicillin-binding protein PBP4 [Staphylococcus aureus]|uniref:penicillin-binding protein PBP4 n=1 Tax=Staphylococcus aureus TaxID=1280 RepID=UPI001EE9019C|nr:penicillin-binding protein PBP4 [Staphylococcus aureus]MCG5661261.1 penicillin-binding protein PBP4 [Staphylococcus aureus]WBV35530.1 penicillin-binding protein PBP4 [Staphylococcus aureus]WIY89132.1 penicillin-binding protein PBP4 [Staphylococcus aureus]WIY94407.1 penicillin-binding protein PBP4 [Staphylococcus aureus]WIY97049.1 penicillin-binding protein PBP4 [Staphylococcus aureus]